MQTEEDIRRRRIMEAMQAGLKVPQQSSFMPGESAGMPDSFWEQKFPFLRGRPKPPGYAPIGGVNNADDIVRQQQRPETDYRPGVDDVTVLPSGKIEQRQGTPLAQSPQVNIPPAAQSGLQLPPARTDIPQEPAPDFGPVEKTQTPVRIGYSTAGLTGVDKLMQRRRALEEASPMSSVKNVDGFEEIDPPKQRKGFLGRLKGIGEGGLTGLAMADPDRPMYGLGQAIGGLATGAASREGGPTLKRKFEMRQFDNDLSRGLKLEQEQAQLGSIEALRRQRELDPILDAQKIEFEREIQNAKLEIERQKAAGLIDKQEADRQQRELDRRSREKIAADRVTSQEKIAGMRPNSQVAKEEERQRKAAAAESEYNSLLIEEKAALDEKNRAYGVLEQVRKSAPNDEMGRIDLKQAEDAAQAADKNYQSFADKKRDAQKRMSENSGGPTASASTPYAGRTMSQANLARYAKDKGISIEEARQRVEAQGVRVQ